MIQLLYDLSLTKILLGMQATGILIAVQSELKLQAQLQNAQARHLKM
nr:MAG TPA: hypothetical protein [Caudoviricetes sp.]